MLICGQRWNVKRRRSHAFSHRGAHFCLRGVVGKRKRFGVAARSEPPKPSAAKATNSDSCGRAEVQLKEPIPEQKRIKKGHSEYSGWTKIEKRNQIINTKNYWKWKGRLCVKLFEVTNTTWENLQIATHKSVSTPHSVALQYADVLRWCLSPLTTSRTISFSISSSF